MIGGGGGGGCAGGYGTPGLATVCTPIDLDENLPLGTLSSPPHGTNPLSIHSIRDSSEKPIVPIVAGWLPVKCLSSKSHFKSFGSIKCI